MKTNTLANDLLYKMDAYWRAANHLSVGLLYLDGLFNPSPSCSSQPGSDASPINAWPSLASTPTR